MKRVTTRYWLRQKLEDYVIPMLMVLSFFLLIGIWLVWGY